MGAVPSNKKFATRAVGIALIVHTTAFALWQHRHLTAQSLHIASLLSTTKDVFTKQSRSIIDCQNNSTVSSHRPASLILRNPNLPDWVKHYASWHKRQRKRYLEAKRQNSSSADDVRFLISRCLEHDVCGGASDRLQDMPWNLMLANRTNRVLLVRWEKPSKLEHYLVPPEDGIDWTVQGEMYEILRKENWNLRGKEENPKLRIVSTIRRDSAAPRFRQYENDEVGHKM